MAYKTSKKAKQSRRTVSKKSPPVIEKEHTPVSNQDEATRIVETSTTFPPFEGSGGGAETEPFSLMQGELENVPSFRPMEVAEIVTNRIAIHEGIIGGTTSVRLPDVGQASFGSNRSESIPEVVIGVDNRVQIQTTRDYPWRAYCSLLITARNNTKWVGTGWFISPSTLITAGHCVFINNKENPSSPANGWVRSIQVMPGRNGSTFPFETVISTQFRSVEGWIENGDENFDYGAIILPRPLGSSLGWLGFGSFTDAELNNSTANIAGYPADKSEGTLWFHASRIIGVNNRKIFYDIDTFGGQSGSPVVRIVGNQRFAVAVHAYGTTSSNNGVRITPEVVNNFNRWKA